MRTLRIIPTMLLVAISLSACNPSEPMRRSFSETWAIRHPKPPEWPMKFKEHAFKPVCYDTLTCLIDYKGIRTRFDKPTLPSSQHGSGYLDRIFSGGISSNDFPDVAKVVWRSKDGEDHRANIDVGAIFSDRLVRHNVPREQVRNLPHGKLHADSRISGYPEIILEVNDRTIRVYMRASIPLKGQKNPHKPWDGFREDLILVRTYQY